MQSSQDLLSQLCCLNCQKLSDQPSVTSCCNAVICSDCKPSIKTTLCQVCGSRNFQIQNNQFLMKLSNQIKLPCQYSCGYHDSLKNLKIHEMQCQLRKYECNLCDFASQGDEFLCHIISQHQQDLLQKFSKGGKEQNQLIFDVDPTKTQINRNKFESRIGANGKYYCSQDLGFNCGCCSGCGPNNGDNCLPCMILDVQARNLPSGYLINKDGATSVMIGNRFTCGRLMTFQRKRCGENNYWCNSCDSLTRNINNYSEAFNKNQNNLIIDPTQSLLNNNNFTSRVGETGKHYCGKDIGFKCGCCTGCGPTNGDNCLPCMILDVKSRSLPKGYLVNKDGATSIFKNEKFQCGRVLDHKRTRCGLNNFYCQACISLIRNTKNYEKAFQE